MTGKMMRLVGIVCSISIVSAAANAQVQTTAGALTQNPVTGHYYQVFGANGISWSGAEIYVSMNVPCLDTAGDVIACNAANAVPPHLVTITSGDEDAFVDGLRRTELLSGGAINRPELWIGGFQPAGSAAGENWEWVSGEGTISTPQVPLPSYSNWLDGEPNDAGSGESYLTTGLFNGFGWNDEGNLGLIGGFIVEWDVPLPAADCIPSASNPDGCTTIVGQTLAFPEGSNPGGATISFNSFEFLDPRVDANGRCSEREVLTIFGETGIGSAPGTRPPMIIPPYLCGSPSFVVVAVNSDQLIIETGTVDVRNETDVVLPGNFYPGLGDPYPGPEDPILGSVCEDPIVLNLDPQYQDIGTWQDTKTPTKMLEVDIDVGGVGEFEGATGEFTNECGSSRLRVKGGSYFGIGLRIDFGPGFELAYNSTGNFDRFVALTRYKLTLLQQSVEDAKADGAFHKNADYNKMKNMVRNAITALDSGLYSNALDLVQNFVKFIGAARYRIVTDENYEGEHLMRGTNIEFTLRVKVVPYAPAPPL